LEGPNGEPSRNFGFANPCPRGGALPQVGGVDGISYHSWAAALIDLSLRLAGLGWRNVLCPNAFVLRTCESILTPGDGEALAARWPAWHARIADCLMRDPLQRAANQPSARCARMASRIRERAASPQPGLPIRRQMLGRVTTREPGGLRAVCPQNAARIPRISWQPDGLPERVS
jgi:hypothetical protein